MEVAVTGKLGRVMSRNEVTQSADTNAVQPMPSPLSVQAASSYVNGRGVVVLRIFTSRGLSVFLMDAEQANVTGNALSREGRLARSGPGIVKSVEGST